MDERPAAVVHALRYYGRLGQEHKGRRLMADDPKAAR